MDGMLAWSVRLGDFCVFTASAMCSECLGQEPGPQWSLMKSLENAPVL